MENKSYINPLCQKVVDVRFGYKVYDNEQKDKVLFRVGGTTPKGDYIYLDTEPIINETDEIAFMPEIIMKTYERVLKYLQSKGDERYEDILKLSANMGFTGKTFIKAHGGTKEKAFEYLQSYCGI